MSEHYYPETPPPVNPLAIASLATGIVSYLGIPFLGALAAIITGHMAKNEIKANPGKYSGEGLATTGLVLGYVHLALIMIGVILFITALALLPSIADWFMGIVKSIQ